MQCADIQTWLTAVKAAPEGMTNTTDVHAAPESMNMGSLIQQLEEPALRSAREQPPDVDDMEYEEDALLFGSEPQVPMHPTLACSCRVP